MPLRSTWKELLQLRMQHPLKLHRHTSVYRGWRTWPRLCKSGLGLAFALGKGRCLACTNTGVVIIKIWLGDLSRQYALHLPYRGHPNCLVLGDGFLRLSIVSRGEKGVGSRSVAEWLVCLLVLRVSLSPPWIHARDFNLNVLYCSRIFCFSVVYGFGVCFFLFCLLTYRFFLRQILLLPFSSHNIDS